MDLEQRLSDILIACKVADWYSTDAKIDYELELSLGSLFAEGRIVFFDSTILEFTDSITPERRKYRFQYMDAENELIFRYDNVPHHKEIATFPDHKHYPDRLAESGR